MGKNYKVTLEGKRSRYFDEFYEAVDHAERLGDRSKVKPLCFYFHEGQWIRFRLASKKDIARVTEAMEGITGKK